MKDKGFTLVELLVVLAISGTLLALVAPLGFRSVERVQVQTELVSIQRWYDRIGYLAFIRGEDISVEWVGEGEIVASVAREILVGRRVDRLEPVDQAPILFTSAGIPNKQSISLKSSQGVTYEVVLAGALSSRSAY